MMDIMGGITAVDIAHKGGDLQTFTGLPHTILQQHYQLHSSTEG